MRQYLIKLTASLAAALALASPAQASVVIAGTRVVYPANEAEVTLKLNNTGKRPALVQVWTDKGSQDAGPSGQGAPFLITPPVFRIDPDQGQTLRIAYTGEPLPQDRESVFWLNVLEVPPKPDEADKTNYLQFAFRSRIKIFFRPAKLVGLAPDAPAQVIWSLSRKGGEVALLARNPSVYYVTFAGIDVSQSDKHASVSTGVMIAPGETTQLPLKGDLDPATQGSVHYQSLNDYGGTVAGDATLRAGSSP